MHVHVYAVDKHSQQKCEMLPRQTLDTTDGHIDKTVSSNRIALNSLLCWSGVT